MLKLKKGKNSFNIPNLSLQCHQKDLETCYFQNIIYIQVYNISLTIVLLLPLDKTN